MCEELWSERNAIFKAAGYCFRTPQAIQAFGNAGCQFDDEADVPLLVR
ncbi:YARHG domain-containing protein [Methylobacterium sp. GXF4]|nr:YARHG domain-containing protein [Methylobacterium sp. GXF4]